MPNIIGTGQMSLVDLNDVIASPTAPNNPIDGALWWNTSENKLYVYSNGQWVFSSDGMVFGGVNLLRNTTFGAVNGTLVKSWNAGVAMVTLNDFLGSSSLKLTRTNWATGQNRVQLQSSIGLIPFTQKGYQYTVSSWIYVDSSVAMTGTTNDIAVRTFKASDNSSRDFRIADLTTLEKDKWVYVKGTFSLQEDIQKMDLMYSLTQNGLIKVSRPQLETGNIASNWSPAPEDGEETISDIQKTLNNLADDNILDYNERQIIRDKVADIIGSLYMGHTGNLPDDNTLMNNATNGQKGSYYNVRKQAQQIGIYTTDARYKKVQTEYEALRTYLNNMIPKPWDTSTANMNQVIKINEAPVNSNKDEFRTKWMNYYNAVSDLATYTIEIAKINSDNAGNIGVVGTNWVSNGDFSMDISKSIWKDNYVGDIKEVVDISSQTPPHQFALHVKTNSAKNGGIFIPVLWDAKMAESLVNRNVTISFWLKYKGITQGAQASMSGRFGELVIEGLKDNGQASTPRYVRFQNATTMSETAYITGTNETWVKYVGTTMLTLPTDATKLKRISFKHGVEACIGEFWTTGIKVEIGDTATPWSDSPVDIYDRISKAEFAVKPDNIVATVRGSSQYKTDIQGAKDYAKDEAKAQFDKIVSMKNLILDSHVDYNTTGYLINDYTLAEDFVAGQKYTFVIKGTVPSGQKFGIWQNGGSTSVGYAETVLYNGVTYVTFTAQATTAGNARSLRLYNAPQNTTSATVDWVALYKGEKPMDWTPASEDVNNKIDNIVVGGNNIIPNSLFKEKGNWRDWGASTGTRETGVSVDLAGFSTGFKFDSAGVTGDYGYVLDKVSVTVGETYTASAWFKLTKDGKARVQEGNSDVKWTYTNGQSDIGKWFRVVHTFVAKADSISIYFGQDSKFPASAGFVTGAQLERGNKATDWSLAQVDIDTTINNIKVGGRNLISGTDFKVVDGWIGWSSGKYENVDVKFDAFNNFDYLFFNTKDDSGANRTVPTNTALGFRGYRRTFAVKKDAEYTLSMIIATSELGNTLDYCYLMHSDNANMKLPVIQVDSFPVYNNIASNNATNFYSVTVTFKATKDDNNAHLLIGGRTIRDLPTDKGNAYAWIRIAKLKVEEGNRATAWSPFPEDSFGGYQNLVLNSDFSMGLDNWNVTNTGGLVDVTDLYGFTKGVSNNGDKPTFLVQVMDNPNALFNKKFVISTYAKYNIASEGTGLKFYIRIIYKDNTGALSNPVYFGTEKYFRGNSNGWTRISYFCDFSTLPSNAVEITEVRLTLQSAEDGVTSGTWTTTGVKVEEGYRATAWCPSIPDGIKQYQAVATRLDKAELKITDSAILGVVTKSTEFKGKADANTVYTKDELANMSTAQLLHNTEWNSDSTGWILSTGWSLDTAKRFEGASTMKCAITGLATNSYRALYSEFIDVKEGQTLIVSGYLYTDNRASFDAGSGIEIEWYNASNTRISTSSSSLIPSANGTWERKSTSGIAPANTVKARARYHPSRNGAFWIAKPMLQYGNILGQWTPHIDELATDLKSQINQTAGRVDIVVGSDNKIKAEQIASAISITPNAINVISNSINLTGKVTFNALDSSLKTDLNNYGSTRSKLETITGGTTYINGGYIRSGTISGVTINVDTDLQVGKEIRLGSMTDFSLKQLRFNNSANISTTNGNIMNISSMVTQIMVGDVYIGNTTNTSVYKTYLMGSIDVTGVTSWIGGVPAVFG